MVSERHCEDKKSVWAV